MTDSSHVTEFLQSQEVRILSVQVDTVGRWVVNFEAERAGCGYLLLGDKIGAHVILPD